MKTAKISTILVLTLCMVFSWAKVSKAAPLGTAFTYQGHLYDNNDVANALYDFQFKLYDANVGGSQIGSDVNVPDVDVMDGYFTVGLDFGSSAFDGNAVWLEIGVRPGDQSDPCQYTPLSPRQEVTPTPYSIFSSNADTLDSLDSAAFASSVHNHDSVYAAVSHSHGGVYALVSHTHDDRYYTKSQLQASGSANVHWNNLTSVPSGFADGVDNVGSGDSDWTISDSNMYSAVSGNVGIGTSSPVYDLDIFATEGFRVIEDAGADSSFIFGEFGETTWDYASIEFARIDQDSGPSGYLKLSDVGTAKVQLHSDGVSYFNGGNVGIGTTIPEETLHVNGNIKTDKVTYTSPREHYYSVAGTDFVTDVSAGIDYYYLDGSAASSIGYFDVYAPVHLPHGASLSSCEVFFHIDSYYYFPIVRFKRTNMSTGLNNILTSIEPPTIDGYQSDSSFIIFNKIVDNTSCNYYLEAILPGGDNRIMGAVITYTLNEAP